MGLTMQYIDSSSNLYYKSRALIIVPSHLTSVWHDIIY